MDAAPVQSAVQASAMDPMYVVPMVAVMVTMMMGLMRAWRGPSVFDRLLAANLVGTKTVLLIAVSGFLLGRPEWLDLALVYAMVNFTGTVAVCRFARHGNLGEEPEGAAGASPTERGSAGGSP